MPDAEASSDQERAQNQVCDARAEIQKELNELRGSTLETAILDGIRQRLSAIQQNVATIRKAGDELDQQRKEEAQAASHAFGAQVESVLGDLGQGGSLSGALTELQNSLIQLRDSYQMILAPIDCD